jgi:hypothetical protein
VAVGELQQAHDRGIGRAQILYRRLADFVHVLLFRAGQHELSCGAFGKVEDDSNIAGARQTAPRSPGAA